MFLSSDRSINVLVNFILPLCIRVGCGRRGKLFSRTSFPSSRSVVVWQCFRPVTDPSMSSLISFYYCVSEWAVVGGVSCF